MSDKLLIVPTQDIAFAVLKDGSRIVNFSNGEGDPQIEHMMTTFKGLADYFESAPEKEFMAASLAWMFMNTAIRDAMVRHVDKIKDEKEDRD